MITELQPNEVFVFGANSSGFHGAGAAGQACRGVSANSWRTDSWFLNAMKAPVGSPERIGKWAVYGVARGFQQGVSGKSYAVQTVTRPGARWSVSLEDITQQLCELCSFALVYAHWSFLVTAIGQGYAGYTKSEIDGCWQSAYNTLPSDVLSLVAMKPANLVFLNEYGDRPC